MRIAYATDIDTDSDIALGLSQQMNAALHADGSEFVVLHDADFQFEYTQEKTQIYYKGNPFHPQGFDALFLGDTLSADLTREFVRAQIPVVNPPDAYFLQEDKIKFMALMQHHGLPIPHSTTVRTMEQVRLATSLIPAPYVIKHPKQEGGTGVFVAESARSLLSIMEYLWTQSPDQRYLIQAFIPTGEHDETSRDYRCTVIGDRIISIVRSSTTDFRTNWSRGGRFQLTTISFEEEAMVRTVAQLSGLEVMGVDFLRGQDGQRYFTELNQAPGLIWEDEAIDQLHIQALIALLKLKVCTNPVP
ncbi:ATP-grasp domain-containing protein [Leptolyngbya sp. AN02str]|uniref:ATP-grasp domain-containing protein n=1 Tax=Leptolyngbya sp. AN02str TaxID=3423363 RepID=UPI003D31C830